MIILYVIAVDKFIISKLLGIELNLLPEVKKRQQRWTTASLNSVVIL